MRNDQKNILLSNLLEDELQINDYEQFKSWNDIKIYYLKNYNIDLEKRHQDIFNDSEYKLVVETEYILKMHYILKALNGMCKVKNNEWIYYPTLQLYKDKEQAQHIADTRIDRYLVGKVNMENCGKPTDFYIVISANLNGMSLLRGEDDHYEADANIGIFACKSKEIAIHLGKYFWREIFNVIYGSHKDYSLLSINE
jgi:hypothetical protein